MIPVACYYEGKQGSRCYLQSPPFLATMQQCGKKWGNFINLSHIIYLWHQLVTRIPKLYAKHNKALCRTTKSELPIYLHVYWYCDINLTFYSISDAYKKPKDVFYWVWTRPTARWSGPHRVWRKPAANPAPTLLAAVGLTEINGIQDLVEHVSG